MNWDLIFHQYDIRGIYPTQLNEETYYILGKSLASFLNVPEIAAGHDMRLSSPSLFKAFILGITDQGVNAVDLGLISTEINYFACGKFNFAGCAIVSASHNPAEYNGLKIVTRGVTPLHGNFGLPQIKQLAQKNKFPEVFKKGQIRKLDVIGDWKDHCLKFLDKSKIRNLKILVDAGNGTGGLSWSRLINEIPANIVPMYFEPDGHFPHHLPDPLKSQNVEDLKREIVKQKADLGFAIDGDADRIFVLDEKGNRLSGTVTTAILADYLLQKYGSAPVLYNAVCGKIVPDIIRKRDGTPIRTRVGHSFIKEMMKKENALFAGEHSGHYYFRDNFFADSSTIAGLIFLEFLSSVNKPLSQITNSYMRYKESGEINYVAKKPHDLVKKMEFLFKDAKSTDWIDGLSVWYNDYWFNLRPSNTEPVVRLNMEADSKEILNKRLPEVEKEIIKLGGTKK